MAHEVLAHLSGTTEAQPIDIVSSPPQSSASDKELRFTSSFNTQNETDISSFAYEHTPCDESCRSIPILPSSPPIGRESSLLSQHGAPSTPSPLSSNISIESPGSNFVDLEEAEKINYIETRGSIQKRDEDTTRAGSRPKRSRPIRLLSPPPTQRKTVFPASGRRPLAPRQSSTPTQGGQILGKKAPRAIPPTASNKSSANRTKLTLTARPASAIQPLTSQYRGSDVDTEVETVNNRYSTPRLKASRKTTIESDSIEKSSRLKVSSTMASSTSKEPARPVDFAINYTV